MIDRKTAERLTGQVWDSEGGVKGAIRRENWLRAQRPDELLNLHDTLTVLATVVGRVLDERLADAVRGP